jgi:hypothetical protein
MLGFFVRTGMRMLMLAGVLYATFFVPLGPYTLYGHMNRIAATAEAHDLFAAVTTRIESATAAVSARVRGLKADAR